MLATIKALKESGDLPGLNRLIPYAQLVGLEATALEGGVITILRQRDSNIGNTQIPAVHGGVVGALLEHAATLELVWELDLEALPRIINISVDYLRPCLNHDTFARGTIIKQGRRIANVRVEAWQSDPAKPVAAAHSHFLLEDATG